MMNKRELKSIEERYRAFLADEGQELFVHRFAGERSEMDFCICRSSIHGWLELLWLHLRYGLIMVALALPWSWPKVFVLRCFGATIGKGVYISQRVHVDAMHPELLTIEDDVLIGYDAKIFCHEISRRAYRVGRVRLKAGCILGAAAMVRPGVTIGRQAEIGALSAVAHSIEDGALAFGVPAKVVAKEG